VTHQAAPGRRPEQAERSGRRTAGLLEGLAVVVAVVSMVGLWFNSWAPSMEYIIDVPVVDGSRRHYAVLLLVLALAVAGAVLAARVRRGTWRPGVGRSGLLAAALVTAAFTYP
jgi:hypothetical protein